jgi:hypothetical protein
MHGACHSQRQDLPKKRLQKLENGPIDEGLMRAAAGEPKGTAWLNGVSSWEDNLRSKSGRGFGA